jgi:hypothetical protein
LFVRLLAETRSLFAREQRLIHLAVALRPRSITPYSMPLRFRSVAFTLGAFEVLRKGLFLDQGLSYRCGPTDRAGDFQIDLLLRVLQLRVDVDDLGMLLRTARAVDL